jgi:hypothetical protein
MTLPLRILAMIPAPSDTPGLDAEREWQALLAALQSFVAAGQLELVRAPIATETGLQHQLAQGAWHILHYIGSGKSMGARYVTLVFEGSGRNGRSVSVQHLSVMLKATPSLDVVFLQASSNCTDSLEGAAALLAGEDATSAAIAIARPPDPASAQLALREVYGCILESRPLTEALRVCERREGLQRIRLHLAEGQSDSGLFLETTPSAGQPVSPPPSQTAAPPQPDAAELARRGREKAAAELKAQLESKRAAGAFDVFLCHHGPDKPAVKRIGRLLLEHGIVPWLDEWELRPGLPWQRLLEEQIAAIKAAAVFVGAEGIGPWQRQELDTFLRQFVARACPVIPVLLPEAAREPRLPLFLEGMTWVDFRVNDPDPLERLIWGITGRRAAFE